MKKSYLEIKVPLRHNATWLNELRALLCSCSVKWQDGYYHITMAFLNEATEEQRKTAKRVMDQHLRDAAPIPMTFDMVDVFKASNDDKYIIHLTSTLSNEAFLALTNAIREDLKDAGLTMDLPFRLHVTLGRMPAQTISIEELRGRIARLSFTPFTRQLDKLVYLTYKEHKTIGKWKLGG